MATETCFEVRTYPARTNNRRTPLARNARRSLPPRRGSPGISCSRDVVLARRRLGATGARESWYPVRRSSCPLARRIAAASRSVWSLPKVANLNLGVSDASAGRKIGRFVRALGRIGRIWMSVCSHDVLTAPFGWPRTRRQASLLQSRTRKGQLASESVASLRSQVKGQRGLRDELYDLLVSLAWNDAQMSRSRSRHVDKPGPIQANATLAAHAPSAISGALRPASTAADRPVPGAELLPRAKETISPAGARRGPSKPAKYARC
jgi:hypothetical protein